MTHVGLAHPVQGLVCVHGYLSRDERTLPVEGLFAAIEAFNVAARVVVSPNSGNGIGDRMIDSSIVLSVDESSRIDQFCDMLQQRFSSLRRIEEIEISTNIPRGWGIGSSGAVFAAITAAVLQGVDPEQQPEEPSAIARRGSYSAAASFVGGISSIRPDTEAEHVTARSVAQPSGLDLQMLVIPVSVDKYAGEKSSERIHADVLTSPYYGAWKEIAAEAVSSVKMAIAKSDVSALSVATESYALANFAVIISGRSGLVPWTGRTVDILHYLRRIRHVSGSQFAICVNTGPSVFVYGDAETLEDVEALLADHSDLPNMGPVISRIGGGATGGVS